MMQLTSYKYRISNTLIQVVDVCLLISIWLFTILTIVKSKGPVPSHFKLDGSIDGYTDSWWLLLILPLTSTAAYFTMMVFIRVIPRVLLFSNSISEIKSEKKQSEIQNMLKGFQILFLIQMFSIVLSIFLIVTKRMQKAPEYVFPSVLIGGGLMIILLIVLTINHKGK